MNARALTALSFGAPLLAGAGALAGGLAWLLHRRTVNAVKAAIDGASPDTRAKVEAAATPAAVAAAVEAAAPPAPPEVRAAAKAGDTAAVKESAWYRGKVDLRLTGYWPFAARPDEKRMEGGLKDRTGRPLHTVEDFFAGKADHVSLSGDDAVWPYGQRVDIPWLGGRTVVGRVTDTGSHFRGAKKLYRVEGHEPIDVCVASSKTEVPKVVEARIVPGDDWRGLTKKTVAAVDTGKIRGQQVVVGFAPLDVLGVGRPVASRSYTPAYCDALARAVEASPARDLDEKQAVAWVHRNRARVLGAPLEAVVWDEGVVPSDEARKVARAVLTLPAAADPTGGAVDYACPEEEAFLERVAEVHRALVVAGDEDAAAAIEPLVAGAVDRGVRREGLVCVGAVGALELYA